MTRRPMLTRLLTLVLAASFFAGCSGPKADPRAAAETFFILCRDGKIAEAYAAAAAQFRIERSQKYFDARVRDLELKGVSTMTWGEAQARGGDVVRIKVDLVIKHGADKPDSTHSMTVTMLLEGGQWRLLNAKEDKGERVDDIFAVAERMADADNYQSRQFLDPVSKPLPTDQQLQLLCEKALLDFGDAVKRQDWSDFYAATSDRWRLRGKTPQQLNYVGSDPRLLEQADPLNKAERLTIAKIKEKFGEFVEKKIDLSPIKGKRMTLDEPARMTSQGVLEVNGRYKDAFAFGGGGLSPVPLRVSFKLEFVFEGSNWKLFGITVNVAVPNAQ